MNIKCLLTTIFIFFSFTQVNSKNNSENSKKLVFAVSMSEMKVPDISGVWNSWNYGTGANPDSISTNGRRFSLLPQYPSIGLYDMADSDYQEYTCQLMKMCYIDGITHHVRGSGDDKHRIDGLTKFALMSKKYGLYGMARGGDGEKCSSDEWVSRQLRWIEIFEPAALYINNKQVTSFFSLNSHKAVDVLLLKKQFNEKYNKELYVISRMKNTPTEQELWKGAFDAGYDWVGFHNGLLSDRNSHGYDWYTTFVQLQLNYFTDLDRAKECLKQELIDKYIEGVSPGFNDIVVNGWKAGSHFVPRLNGYVYEWRWKNAIKNNYSMIFIPTWNDFPEGSVIQPTVEFGNLYMELTRKYAAQYKGIIPNQANLMVPEWIYKIRKMTKDTSILEDMNKACDAIIKSDYYLAETLVVKHVSSLHFLENKYFDCWINHSIK